MKRYKTTRREFLKATAATAVAGPAAAGHAAAHVLQAPALPAQEVAPSDRIRIGLIGAGGQGMGDTHAALETPGVELVAVADCYDGRLVRARELWGDSLQTTRDYREVLARSDVDAVIIAAPDHWHVPIAIEALEAGKDVYVEKPMVQKADEGRRLLEVERRTTRILQVGSQRVSSILYAKARELIAAGAIGRPNMVEAWINRNSALGAWQYSIPPDASPDTIDWERFLGRAPKRPFDPVRFFRWRNYKDYGTGVPGDLFVHLFSGTHFVMRSNGPTRIVTTGGLRYWHDGRDVPDIMLGLYDYPKTPEHPEFNIVLKVNFADGGGETSAFRFVGPEGVVTIGWNQVTLSKRPRPSEPGYTIDTFPEAVQEAFLLEYREKHPERPPEVLPGGEEIWVAPQDYSDLVDHFRVFFEAVRTRKPVVEDGAFGLRAAGPAVLSNVSYAEGRPVEWDPVAMRVTGRSDA